MPSALLVLFVLLACAPAPDDARWSRIELRGTPIGWLEIRERGDTVEETRTLRVLEAGRRVERTGTLRTTHGPDGEVLSACRAPEGGCWRAGPEPVWLPRQAPDGEHLLLDTWTLRAEATRIERGRFHFAGLAWELGHGEVRAGPLTFREVAHRPDVPPVDVGALITRRVGPGIPAAPHYARFLVDGREREIRAPIPLELPPADRAVLRSLSRVDTTGDCKARSRDAADAARRLGWEARVVHGLALVDGALAPHAWVEVSLPSGRWALDPTLDQPVADATHLPLTPAELLASDVELLEAR